MQPTPTISLWQLLSPLRLLGPLSDRELRVASRRGWSYAWRTGYILLLCVLTLSAWYQIVGLRAAQWAAASATSQASVVSRQVATQVILFQFVAAQLIAALMLSSSVGDEMRRGTLGVLLATPIRSVHIVGGKLLGGLLHILLLLGIGLPALTVLRVLGGLSWEEVFAAFWITLTAALFAASLSLLLSTYHRHSFQAISAGAVVYLVLFVGLPYLAAYLAAAGALNQPVTLSVLDLTNPFRALYGSMPRVRAVPAAGVGRFFSWPIHCLIMAGAVVVIICLSVRRIRRVAVTERLGRGRSTWAIERLWGPPVAWKEDPCARLLGKRALVIIIITLVLCALLLATRGGPGVGAIYSYNGVGGLWLVAFLRLAIVTAGSIGREKESGAWPVLLTTPLDEGQILWGKARAALRRDGVMLLGLFAVEVCVLLSLNGFRDRWPIVAHALVRPAGAIVLMLGAGLYWGVRLRTTTAAVTAALVTLLCLHHFLGGHYNPLWAWWFGKLIVNTASQSNNYLQLYGLAMMGAAFVLDAALGLFLWRRARQNARIYVF